jgi:WS/DGAT/MGAT family acyltransferase
VDPLAGLDSAFLSLETGTSRLHVGLVMVLDPPEGRRSLFSSSTRFAQIRRVLQQRVHLVRPLRQRPVPAPLGLGHPVWADDPTFDLDDHLRRGALPAPGGPAELEELVADFLGGPLDLDRPLWELMVVEGLAGGRTAVVAKLHHAILDGVSGATLMSSFLDAGPRDRPAPVFGIGTTPPGPKAHELWWHVASGLLRVPGTLRSAIGGGISALQQGLEPSADGAGRPLLFGAPRTSMNGTVSQRRRFATTSIPMADLERVRRSFGTTQNDVVLAAVSGGVRRLLAAREEATDRSLVALVPISTRRRDGRGQLGNRIAGMLVPLGTDIEEPGARLKAVAAHARAAKRRYRATKGGVLRDAVELSPPLVVQRLARWTNALRLFDRAPPVSNLVVSNIPGPSNPLWFAGSRVVAVYPVGPVAHGVGLNVTALGYAGRLWFGLLGCGRLAPDVGLLASLIDEAMEELLAAAGSGSGPRSATNVAEG